LDLNLIPVSIIAVLNGAALTPGMRSVRLRVGSMPLLCCAGSKLLKDIKDSFLDPETIRLDLTTFTIDFPHSPEICTKVRNIFYLSGKAVDAANSFTNSAHHPPMPRTIWCHQPFADPQAVLLDLVSVFVQFPHRPNIGTEVWNVLDLLS
jgi:hypothetical protein